MPVTPAPVQTRRIESMGCPLRVEIVLMNEIQIARLVLDGLEFVSLARTHFSDVGSIPYRALVDPGRVNPRTATHISRLVSETASGLLFASGRPLVVVAVVHGSPDVCGFVDYPLETGVLAVYGVWGDRALSVLVSVYLRFATAGGHADAGLREELFRFRIYFDFIFFVVSFFLSFALLFLSP